MKHSSNKKKILVISPTPTHPQTAGNRARIHALITGMQSLGHDVYFLHIEKEAGDEGAMRDCWGDRYLSVPYRMPARPLSKIKRKVCKWLGSEGQYTYGIDEWYDPAADAFIRRISGEIGFDMAIVEYVFFSRALECFGRDVLKLLDTHDVFTNRHRRYLEQGKKPLWFSTSRQEEAHALGRADIVIAIQGNEAQFFREIAPRHVVTVGHIVPLSTPGMRDAHGPAILYVGSGNEINVHAANYFINNVLPGIKKQIPEVTLKVAGGVCGKLSAAPGVHLLGHVEDLAPIYEAVSVVVNPMLFGTGLKIKTIEALGFGKALVTTSIGAEGLEDLAGKAFLVADTAQAFSAAVIKLLSDREARQSLARSAYDHATIWNQGCMSELTAALNGKTSRIETVGSRA